jgi:undecaprenyl diphosphate synthase
MGLLCTEKSFVVDLGLPAGSSQVPPLHVAIIMDGNGRWAQRHGQPRSAGHVAGAGNVRRIVAAAVELGIGTLTVYAFSADNWQRPAAEVARLMHLMREFLRRDVRRCARQGIRITVIGRRDRLSEDLRQAIDDAERATAGGSRLHLRIAVDYSSRETIYRAACRFYKATRVDRDSFAELLGEVNHGEVSNVDLLIRTGGEQRLSDFLLWEAAYAELYFSPLMWPEFGAEELAAALEEYRVRERRFGRVVDRPNPAGDDGQRATPPQEKETIDQSEEAEAEPLVSQKR